MMALRPDHSRPLRDSVPLTAPVLQIPLAEPAPLAFLPETRGYYMSYSGQFEPDSIRREIEWAARAGFNLLLFPVYVNGFTFFPCESTRAAGFLPINPKFKGRDPLFEALEMARDLGLSGFGLVRPYNFHPRYSLIEHQLLKKHREWRMMIHPHARSSRLRRREDYVACPVNVDYRRYLGDMLSELVSGYPLDGLVMNYTGYGLRDGTLKESPFCFCQECCRQYTEQTQGDLIRNAASPERLPEVRRWQREASTRSIDYLRHRVIKQRRSMRFVGRAQPQWRWNSEDSGPQLYPRYTLDWNSLLRQGLLEGLLIDHDDEQTSELFSARMVTDLCELHHEALLLTMVKIARPRDLSGPLKAIRRYPVPGFLAEFTETPTDRDADIIREEYLHEPAQVPELLPLLSVAFLFQRTRQNHSDNDLIGDLMRDFLRLIDRALSEGTTFGLLQILYENLDGLQDAIRRNRLGGYVVPESTLRDIGLARRLIRLACLDVRS